MLICLASGLKMEHAHDLYIDPVGDSLAEQILLLHTHHYNSEHHLCESSHDA